MAPLTWALMLAAIFTELWAWPLQLPSAQWSWVWIIVGFVLLAAAWRTDVRWRSHHLTGGSSGALGRPVPVLLAVLPHELHADILSQIESAIIGFFVSIWNGIANFFGTIFQAIANTFAVIFSAPGAAIQASFASLTIWASGYGPLAPLITIGVVSAVLIIATFLIWVIIKVSVSEAEQTGEEAEEGV